MFYYTPEFAAVTDDIPGKFIDSDRKKWLLSLWGGGCILSLYFMVYLKLILKQFQKIFKKFDVSISSSIS